MPDEEKAKAIAKENADKKDKEEAAKDEEEAEIDGNTFEKLTEQLHEIAKKLKSESIKPEEFEKDDDTNFHIDAIHSLANLRSRNYTLDPMDWMTVKIKAGRIIPALATTTASIAGLQTLEVVKIIKKIKVEDVKNAFLNLAVPLLTQSEPAPPNKNKLSESHVYTSWDRWDLNGFGEKTLQDVFDWIVEHQKLYPRDVIHGTKPVYMQSVGDTSNILKQTLKEVFGAEPGDHIDLTITTSLEETGGEICQGVPQVRLNF